MHKQGINKKKDITPTENLKLKNTIIDVFIRWIDQSH